ncbi:hypothetical protein B9G55_05000 [Saccharibacillus sp. O16]|nr:hypothetical protein B9G55_05000 [Saccharibacillus sp. O16]
MFELRYEKNDHEVIENNPSRERIGEILRKLDDYKRSFCCLTVHDRLYIQSAGSYEAMIVEMRVPYEDGFRHYAIGHEPERVGRTEREREDNEQFDAEEAEKMFLSFIDTYDIPEGYAKRDMSDMFA